MTRRTLAAYTAPGSDQPPYFCVTEEIGGDVTVTVRNAAGVTSSLEVPRLVWLRLLAGGPPS